MVDWPLTHRIAKSYKPNGDAPDLGVLVTPQPHHALDDLVLHAE